MMKKVVKWLIPASLLFFAAADAEVAPFVLDIQTQVKVTDPAAVLRAIDDMAAQYPGRYDAVKYRKAVEAFAVRREVLIKDLSTGSDKAVSEAQTLLKGVHAALLANPLLDGDRLVFVRRHIKNAARDDMRKMLGFISLNSHCHVTIDRKGWDDEIVELSGLRGEPKMKTIYKPNSDVLIRDLDVNFSGKRMLFTSLDDKGKWAVYEINTDGTGLKQMSPSGYPDVDWFNAVYLPDGRLVMLSTASYQALPCENGSMPMAQLYQVDPGTGKTSQLTFEQDSDYTPSITNDGRVLYTRWEYSDLPHYFTRILMTMNPDGTLQQPVYGSGSYFPTALLQSRAIPGTSGKFITVVGGHHDLSEIGRLILLDTSLARSYPFKYKPENKEWGPQGSFLRIKTEVLPKEQTGCVAEIPGWGKPVEGDVCDRQVGNQFERNKPYFNRPWPLSDKYFLVTAKLHQKGLWGIYLVDVFDNMTLLAEAENDGMFEAIPVQPRPRPPVIPDRIDLESKNATVNIGNIYEGAGLKNIPKGTVKALRIFSYHFNYVNTGGHASLGIESAWDIKRILGTVPVEADGSANFTIPANTPVSLQPLDKDGAALQLMRSWLVGKPGEYVSCNGCHEDNRTSPPVGRALANRRPPSDIVPWYGEARPFAFKYEVYPTLQKYCVGCHDGNDTPKRAPDQGGAVKPGTLAMSDARKSYDLLHPYVRRPGPESELPTLEPMEYHVSTSPLFQMLEKGHYGVKLDREAFERLAAWVDLNAPYKGHWKPNPFKNQPQAKRRAELSSIFANTTVCPEDEYDRIAAAAKNSTPPAFVKPDPVPAVINDTLKVAGFPLNAESATALQKVQGEVRRTVILPNGGKIDFVRIPAGTFVMGSLEGTPDERPRAVVNIPKSFWMSECEITNAQYHAFDPAHDTRYVDAHGKDHTAPGYIANHDNQPVARLTWRRASAFCEWLSQQAKISVRLPTEAQWEWAARAGSATDYFYGTKDDDFSPFANLADRSTRWNNVGYVGSGVQKREPYGPEMNFPLHEERFEDKWFVVDYVAQYSANAWGLRDMVGNVSEWTRTSYRPYPYRDDDGRNADNPDEPKVARGGSWASRPREAGSAFRLKYASYQPVHDVGFRVIIEEK